MSSIQLPASLTAPYQLRAAHDVRVAIVASLWNSEVMERLLQGAINALTASGLEQTELGTDQWEGAHMDDEDADNETPILNMAAHRAAAEAAAAKEEDDDYAEAPQPTRRGGISGAYQELQKGQLSVSQPAQRATPPPLPGTQPSAAPEPRAQMATLPRIIDIGDDVDETTPQVDEESGPGQFVVIRVPGAFELPLAAQFAMERHDLDGVITLGCIVRGGTPHFDYVCQATAAGVMQAGLATGRPVIFGVLTTDDQQQALERSGGPHGHKGQEAANTLLHMIDLMAE